MHPHIRHYRVGTKRVECRVAVTVLEQTGSLPARTVFQNPATSLKYYSYGGVDGTKAVPLDASVVSVAIRAHAAGPDYDLVPDTTLTILDPPDEVEATALVVGKDIPPGSVGDTVAEAHRCRLSGEDLSWMASYDRIILPRADLRGADLSALDPAALDLRGARRLSTDPVPTGWTVHTSYAAMHAAEVARARRRRGRGFWFQGISPHEPFAWTVTAEDRWLGAA